MARRARYRSWSLRGVDPLVAQRYFQLGDGVHVLASHIRQMAEFRHMDLGDITAPDAAVPGFDLILCRNVFAHLSDETIDRAMRRFGHCLLEDGVLLLAPADIRRVDYPGLRFEREPGLHLFRRAEAGPSPMDPSTSVSAATMPSGTCMPFAPLPHDPRTMTPPPVEAPDPEVVMRVALEARHFIDRREWDGLLAALDAPEVSRQCEPRHGYLRALALVQLGRLDEAAAHCERTLSLAPLLPDAQFLWGMLALERGRRVDAEHAFQRALYLDPAFAEAHWQMAMLLLAQRRRESALRHVELALSALDVGNPEQPAHPLFVLSRGELSEAIAALQCDLSRAGSRLRAAS